MSVATGSGSLPAVAVIMSTYNGEKYLREQIDSILAQEGVRVELYVRDDGSSDGTKGIISEYAGRCRNVHADFGENVGIGRSFMNALFSAGEYGYYAFSDQDDFWMPEKLSEAVRLVRQKEDELGEGIPVAYYSNIHSTDSGLNIKRTTAKHKRLQTFGCALVKRCVGGCTMLFNAKAREILKSRPITDNMLVHYHDSLVVSVVFSMGGVLVCDPVPHILYRQHGSNTAGSAIGTMNRIRMEIRDLLKFRGCEPKIAREILRAWDSDIDPEARPILETVASYRENLLSRLRIIFSPAFRTGDLRLTLLGKVKALLGLL